MSRALLTEEEKRQRRNEASRRCYLKRKAAAQNGQIEPMGVKNRSVGRPPKAPSVVRDTEKLVKKFTKTASNIKPMLKNAAEILIDAYKNYDDKTIQKIERMMIRDLGLVIVSPGLEDLSKSKVGIEMWSKSIKTPASRLTAIDDNDSDSDDNDSDDTESNDNDDTDITDDDFENPNEIPVDPSQLDNIDAEADMTSMDIDDFSNDDIEDEDDDEFDDEDDDEDEFDDDEDEFDDDDDEDEDISENRRRRRNDFDTASDYEAGRWDMLNEMGAQGAFDD